jgi:hypothetical protein
MYRVERRLGGRITPVYQAQELNPPRPVALKLLPLELGVDPAAARFKDEARKAMALNHSAIVPVYCVGLRAGAPYFVAMKLVEGRGLDAVIAAQGALPLAAVLVVLRAAAEALQYAQTHGTSHGHLHAGNILVDRHGRVAVSEFGIARAIEDAVPAAGGKGLPTSPGHAAGDAVAERSDEYALGIVALEMLTGSAPRDADALRSVRDLSSMREGLPDELLQVLQTALAHDPARRYASAGDMLAAIKAIPFSDNERREGYSVLGRLARDEPVPRVYTRSPAPHGEARTAARTAAPPAPIAAAPVVPAKRPVPAAPPREVVPPPPSARGVPAVPAERPAPAAPLQEAVPPTPSPRAVPVAPVVRLRPSRRAVMTAMAEPSPGWRARAIWVIAAVVVTGGLAVGAYWLLGRRPGAGPATRAPVASQAQPGPGPSVTPGVPVAAESARSDTARPVSVARDTIQSASAFPPEPTGGLFLTVVPPAAQVLVDGRETGSGGVVDTEELAGPRHLLISAPGYVTFDTVVTVLEGETLELGRITLTASAPARPATGRLRLRTIPPMAEISVDGRSVGVGQFGDFDVSPGQRRLRISARGYVTIDTLVTVPAGATVELGVFTLTRSPGGR